MKLTRRGRVTVALGILALVALALVVPGYVYLKSIGLVGSSDPGKPVKVVVPDGANATSIGELLEKKGVIQSAFGFRLSMFMDGGDVQIQAGKYTLSTGLTPGDALTQLEKGPEIEFVTMTFPEGSWIVDFAAALEEKTHIKAKDFLEAATSGEIRSKYQPEDIDTLEGLLFPSTYQIVETDTAESVVQRLVDEMEKRTAEVGFDRAERTGVSPYEALIVASMIENEAALDEERPKVARVIYNRLNEGMMLGIDATVLYAIGEHKETLTESDLAVDSPYNTRLVTGLPPTPIGAPGLASLEAAVQPADGPWLYYVLADCEGHHAFSESYDEFLQNKAVYQELEC
jgi:UPF0755 protein